MKEDFYPFDSYMSSNVANCFKTGFDKEVLVSTLRLLSETGFCPLEDINEPVAEVLSRFNVGAIVKPASLNIGLPKSVWNDGCEYGLVPTSQSARLVIAKYLLNRKYVE